MFSMTKRLCKSDKKRTEYKGGYFQDISNSQSSLIFFFFFFHLNPLYRNCKRHVKNPELIPSSNRNNF